MQVSVTMYFLKLIEFCFKIKLHVKRIIENKRSNCTAIKEVFQAYYLVLTIHSTLLVIIISLISLLGYIIHQEWTLLQSNLDMIKDFPVPCSLLSLSPDEDYITFDLNKSGLKTFIDDKGNYICSKRNLTEIVQTVVEKEGRIHLAQGKEKRYLACGNESLRETSGYQTAFFREILKQQNNSDTQAADDKLYWNIHPSKCYMDKSIQYDNGEVTIPEGRGYFLYTSVHFNISHRHSNDQKGFQRPQRITIRICKSIYGYEQTLVGRSEVFNPTNTGDVVGSLKIETHVHLTKNDKIYVRVNDASRIIHNSKGNTFGLFPL
ncbi:uncharacterized protein LOC132760206 isoform X2 [Ruditapes philippinarum]|uniref:uncharacterized protein LOC132760206 isoform X2 n=1 Tax=Ruditapes philippinarum TaxID=129788 RepID=UPI00295BB560|nr:uncharacterized protein LOC132760206 isoform X2 [Ruditapes philippinarum]